jgi:hypothetical protein
LPQRVPIRQRRKSRRRKAKDQTSTPLTFCIFDTICALFRQSQHWPHGPRNNPAPCREF